MLSLYAGKLSKARLITKINRIAFENVTSEMNLGSVIYPKQIVADHIVQYVRALQNTQGSNVETLYKIADGKRLLNSRLRMILKSFIILLPK